jgi:hypothetical protein
MSSITFRKAVKAAMGGTMAKVTIDFQNGYYFMSSNT